MPSSKLKPAKQQVVWLFKSVMPKEQVVPLTAPFDTLLVCVGVYTESRGPEAKFTNSFFLIRNVVLCSGTSTAKKCAPFLLCAI